MRRAEGREPRAGLLVLALLVAGCTSAISGPGGTGGGDGTGGSGGSGGAGGGAACVPVGRNDEIRLALEKACAGCHLTGNKPFFASLEAFEGGLAYETKYVTPGDPDNSLLIKLLKGGAPGSYPQMPPGESYATLLADGRATLSIAELEQWVRELPPAPVRLAEPVPQNFEVRRLTAEEMVQSLMDQLGLTVEDFVDTSRPTWREEGWEVRGGRLFIWPYDWAPGISTAYVSDARATERFEALGGGVFLNYRKRDKQLGPSAMQTLVQVSQAWCQLALEKPGNTAVLGTLTLADTSATKSTQIKDNIGQLHLRMLGEPATAAEVDALYQGAYLPYESTSTKVAWTSVCASFVRHPLWLSY